MTRSNFNRASVLRALLVIVIVTLVVAQYSGIRSLYSSFGFILDENPAAANDEMPLMMGQHHGNRTIYLINTVRYHFEVVIPFLHVFSNLPNASVTLFASPQGYNRFEVRPWLDLYARPRKLDMVDSSNLVADGARTDNARYATPDFIFLTSCPEDVESIKDTLDRYLRNGAKVQCLVHEAQKWDSNEQDDNKSPYKSQINFMRPWIRAGQWQIVTLAPHVQKFVEKNFATFFNLPHDSWAFATPVVCPVFQLPDNEIRLESDHPYVTIVGKLEPWRRNYDKIFKQLAEHAPPVDLHLIGYGMPFDPPEAVRNKVIHELGLGFPDYFRAISRAIAVVPSFATQNYVESQASSSIATSLIAASPPLMTKKMLEAYSNIPQDAVWVQADDETEIEAFSRISLLGQDAWREKKTQIAKVRDEMIASNMRFFQDQLKSLPEWD
ncbi:hypothetical protein V1514DRAFT_346883 [Lipomyces japonicus]|uniref:uncharacterized protein n=1 Tax=Lipomyces japonicus TaxID=56871 RepID=UPI0034CF9AE5